MTKKRYNSLRDASQNYAHFQETLPRSINGSPYVGEYSGGNTKTASSAVNLGDLATLGAMSNGSVYRNPSRRFYDPEVTTTAIYLPRTLKQKNRWRRWFFDHDEFIGAVLELHSELPYSRAELVFDDKSIKRHVDECVDRTKLFSKLPQIDLEYLKIGEVFINTPWDNSVGMWSHIIPHNPDFVEVSASPFAEDNYVIELIPDDQLKAIVNSTKPHDQQLKRRLPADVIRRVTSGQNLLLDPDEVTHIARKSNPYDLRGTSILDRLFRCYIPGTPARMADGTLKPIEELVIGEEVISRNGEIQKITDVVNYDVSTNLIYLRPQQSRIPLISTEGHEYLIRRKLLSCDNKESLDSDKGSVEYKIFKTEAQDIQLFDQLLVPISKEVIETELNENRARLLGYYLTEGYDPSNKSICFTFCDDGKETWIKDVITILKEEFHIDANAYKDGENCLTINVNKPEEYKLLYEFISQYVEDNYSYSWKLKKDVLWYPPHIQLQILIGEFRKAGWYQVEPVAECSAFTLSKELGEQLEWMLIRNRFYAFIGVLPIKEIPMNESRVEERKSFVDNSKEAYVVTLGRTDFVKEFVCKCWGIKYDLTSEEDAVFKPIDALKDNTTNLIDMDDNYFYVSIVEVDRVKYTGLVHDISVSNNHWWLVDKFVGSNTLMYEDKLREAQITIADNFIYPLKIFKLGDPQKGWIPNTSHLSALAQMLQQATLDPNFALIYHYGLQVDYMTVADKIMRLDPEWSEINNKKAIALGVSQQFLTGETTYASANVGLQTQLARYKAKRDLIELIWLRNKFFKVMAQRNEWYKRDKKELVGQYRVARSGVELEERLILPKIVWHKKLMMRDDQSFLTFMSNIYANGRGPLSTVTMLQAMGLELEEELSRKKLQEELEDRIGAFVQPPAATSTGGSPGGLLPSLANLKNRFIKKADTNLEVLANKNFEESDNNEPMNIDANFFTGHVPNPINFISKDDQEKQEKQSSFKMYNYIKNSLIDEERSLKLSSHRLDPLLVSLLKKAQDLSFSNDKELNLIIRKVYGLGKNYAYTTTGFIPYTNFKVSGLLGNDENLDYSDVVNIRKFEEWLSTIFNNDDAEIIDLISLLLSVYCHGQITGYEEQGIFNVRLTNVPNREGLSFKSNDLLKNGINLSGLLSTDLDIPLFTPYINSITNVDVADGLYNLNTLDPQVAPFKTFYIMDMEVNNCPIELIEESEQLYNKIYNILQNEGINQINYVNDIVDEPQWEENEIQLIKTSLDNDEKDLKDNEKLDSMTKNLLVSSKLKAKKDLHRGCLNFARVGNLLLISNDILRVKKSLTAQLFSEINLLNSQKNKNLIQSKFALNHNLSPEEIKVSLLYNCILPIQDESKNIVGYKVNANVDNAQSINSKLVKQGFWDAEGNILESKKLSPFSVFLDNIETYINYPYKLDDKLKICYGSLNAKIHKK